MSNYQSVIDTLQEKDLSWTEIDRIHLNEESYKDLQKRSSFNLNNYDTRRNSPVIREVSGTEKIVYVSESGIEVTIEL